MNTQTTNRTASASASSNDDSELPLNSGLRLIPGTTWTYADAADMASECQREDRIFGTRHAVPTVRRRRSLRLALKRAEAFRTRFQDQTGWSWDDAVKEALAAQNDTRSPLARILDRCDA